MRARSLCAAPFLLPLGGASTPRGPAAHHHTMTGRACGFRCLRAYQNKERRWRHCNQIPFHSSHQLRSLALRLCLLAVAVRAPIVVVLKETSRRAVDVIMVVIGDDWRELVRQLVLAHANHQRRPVLAVLLPHFGRLDEHHRQREAGVLEPAARPRRVDWRRRVEDGHVRPAALDRDVDPPPRPRRAPRPRPRTPRQPRARPSPRRATPRRAARRQAAWRAPR